MTPTGSDRPVQRRRFFCENCGQEVKPTAKLCPHCGAFFTNVRCPQCNYTGKAHEFTRGCPVCGYLGNIEAERRRSAAGLSTTDRVISVDGYPGPKEGRRGRRIAKKRETPWWLFPLIMAVLVLSFIVLSVVYMRL